MHYVKAIGWVLLGLGMWITGHFVAVILFLTVSIYTIGVMIKMEKDDDS